MTISIASLKAHLADFLSGIEGVVSTDFHLGLDTFVTFLEGRGVSTGGIVQDDTLVTPIAVVETAPAELNPPPIPGSVNESVVNGDPIAPSGEPLQLITDEAQAAITAADAAVAATTPIVEVAAAVVETTAAAVDGTIVASATVAATDTAPAAQP